MTIIYNYVVMAGDNMTKVSSSKKKLRRRMVFLGFGSILVIVTMIFTMTRYWVLIIEKYQEKKKLEDELLALKDKEKELELDAKKLQDSEYIARYAREKYLFSKNGEFVIKMPEDE